MGKCSTFMMTALSLSGDVVRWSDHVADPDRHPVLVCRICKQQVHARAGEQRKGSFCHNPEGVPLNRKPPDGELHVTCQKLIAAGFEFWIPSFSGNGGGMLTKLTSSRYEVTMISEDGETCSLDVVGTIPDGSEVVIEIDDTHATRGLGLRKRQAVGKRCLEISVGDLHGTQPTVAQIAMALRQQHRSRWLVTRWSEFSSHRISLEEAIRLSGGGRVGEVREKRRSRVKVVEVPLLDWGGIGHV